jgi:aminoglycoside phosphotransferase (APT) family kinase protein
VAASSSHDARTSSRAQRFELLRELGSCVVPVWAALESLPNAGTRVVVAERVLRRGHHSDQDIGDWMRDARRLATLDHPNVSRVRDVVIRDEDVLVVSDFVDGVSWSELTSSAQPPSLEVALRVLVDVLSGLSAVHNLRDAKRQPLKLVHGDP